MIRQSGRARARDDNRVEEQIVARFVEMTRLVDVRAAADERTANDPDPIVQYVRGRGGVALIEDLVRDLGLTLPQALSETMRLHIDGRLWTDGARVRNVTR